MAARIFLLKKKKMSSELSEAPSSMPGRAHLCLVGKQTVGEACEAKYSALHLGGNIPGQKSRSGAVRRAQLAEEKDQKIRNGGWGPPQALSSQRSAREYAYLP